MDGPVVVQLEAHPGLAGEIRGRPPRATAVPAPNVALADLHERVRWSGDPPGAEGGDDRAFAGWPAIRARGESAHEAGSGRDPIVAVWAGKAERKLGLRMSCAIDGAVRQVAGRGVGDAPDLAVGGGSV